MDPNGWNTWHIWNTSGNFDEHCTTVQIQRLRLSNDALVKQACAVWRRTATLAEELDARGPGHGLISVVMFDYRV